MGLLLAKEMGTQLSGPLHTITAVLGPHLGKKVGIFTVHYGNILSNHLFSVCYLMPVLNGQREELLMSCEGCGDQMGKEEAPSSQVH